MLYKLAEQNHVRVTGNEHTGSFPCRGVEGEYEFGEDDVYFRPRTLREIKRARAKR
jgi:hypothetical protein